MNIDETTRFVHSTLRPMAEYTFPYLASIVGVVDSQRGEHLGSAFRCMLSGRRAVVTALHVIERARGEYPGFAISAGYGIPPYPVHGKVTVSRVADLGVYFLPDDYPQGAGLAYWPEDRIDPSDKRLGTDYLFVHGFPGVQSYPSQLLGGIVNRSLPYGAMQRLREEGLPNDVDDRSQFALNFDPRNIRVESGEPGDMLPDPRGLSGGPVWRIGVSGRPAKDWTPDWSVLVGVVTQWRTDAELLVATKASQILELMKPEE